MMKIQLDIKDNMSKADEISIIEKISDTLKKVDNGSKEPTNYLKCLFNESFIFWVKQQIQNDIFPEVMQYIDGYHIKEDELERANGKIKLLIEDNETLKAENEKLNDKIFDFFQRLGEVNAEHEKEVDEYLHELEQVKQSLEQKEEEIIRLKAKLYDLMSK